MSMTKKFLFLFLMILFVGIQPDFVFADGLDEIEENFVQREEKPKKAPPKNNSMPAVALDDFPSVGSAPTPRPATVTTAWRIRDLFKQRQPKTQETTYLMGVGPRSGRYNRPPNSLGTNAMGQGNVGIQAIPAPVAPWDWYPEPGKPGTPYHSRQLYPSRNFCPQPSVDRCPLILQADAIEPYDSGYSNHPLPQQLPSQLVIGEPEVATLALQGNEPEYGYASSGHPRSEILDRNMKLRPAPEQLYIQNNPYVERYKQVNPKQYTTLSDHMKSNPPAPAEYQGKKTTGFFNRVMDRLGLTEEEKRQKTNQEKKSHYDVPTKQLSASSDNVVRYDRKMTTNRMPNTAGAQQVLPRVNSPALHGLDKGRAYSQSSDRQAIHIATIYFPPHADVLDEQDFRVLQDIADIYRKQGGALRLIGDIGDTERVKFPGDPHERFRRSVAPSLRLAEIVANQMRQMGIGEEKITILAAHQDVVPEGGVNVLSRAGDNKKRVEVFLEY